MTCFFCGKENENINNESLPNIFIIKQQALTKNTDSNNMCLECVNSEISTLILSKSNDYEILLKVWKLTNTVEAIEYKYKKSLFLKTLTPSYCSDNEIFKNYNDNNKYEFILEMPKIYEEIYKIDKIVNDILILKNTKYEKNKEPGIIKNNEIYKELNNDYEEKLKTENSLNNELNEINEIFNSMIKKENEEESIEPTGDENISIRKKSGGFNKSIISLRNLIIFSKEFKYPYSNKTKKQLYTELNNINIDNFKFDQLIKYCKFKNIKKYSKYKNTKSLITFIKYSENN